MSVAYVCDYSIVTVCKNSFILSCEFVTTYNCLCYGAVSYYVVIYSIYIQKELNCFMSIIRTLKGLDIHEWLRQCPFIQYMTLL